MRRGGWAGVVLAGLALATAVPGTADAAADTTAPVVRSLSVTPSRADTSRGDAVATFDVRIVDPESDVWGFTLSGFGYVPAAGAPADFRVRAVSIPFGEDSVLVSGTARDGVWRRTVSLPAGTRGSFRFDLGTGNSAGLSTDLDSARLTAAGLPGKVDVTLSGPPGRPAYVHGWSTWSTWPTPSRRQLAWLPGTPASSNFVIESTTPACGSPGGRRVQDTFEPGAVPTATAWFNPQLLAPCTVTFRLVNAAGYSPLITNTFV